MSGTWGVVGAKPVPFPVPFGQFTGVLSNLVANTFYASSLYNPVTQPINRLCTFITTSSGNIALALFADSAGVPGARIVTTGSVASPGTGAQKLAVAETEIPAGIVWLGIAADNATFQTRIVSAASVQTFNGTTMVPARSRTSSFPPADPLGTSVVAGLSPVVWAEYV